MELLKETPLEVGWLTWHWRPREPALTVVVKATFDLVPEGLCPLADPQEPLTGELYHDDDPEQSLRLDTDLAPYKPHGECFVLGSFHAPGGEPVRRSQAAFRIGPITKSAAVLGDRHWSGFGPSEPQPFVSMPLRWERAFGGRSSRDNPLGRGLDDVEVSGKRVRLLPNLEDPQALVDGKGDRPRPICFAPVPRTFPSRLVLAGTYDARWLKERYPLLPEDLAFTYFAAAPPDQHIAGFWRGDEEIALMNLVEGHARVRCALPGLRPRCLLVRHDGGPALATELELRLDTITVDGDAKKVFCAWRAPREVAHASLEDYAHLFVGHDEPSAPRSLDRLRADAAAALARREAEQQAHEPEGPATLARGVAPAPLFKTLVGTELKWASVDQAITAAAHSAPIELLQDMQALLRARGTDPASIVGWLAEQLPSVLEPPPVERPLDDAELRALEARVLDEERERQASGAPAALRRRVQEALSAGESCAGWDLSEVDLSRLRLSGGDFREARFTSANLSGAIVGDAVFDGAVFDRAELGDASFHDASFVRATIHFCRLERTHFGDCVLDDSVITESFLRDARFSRTHARRIELSGSYLEGTTFDDCDLSAADFTGATLDDALFARTALVDARLLDGMSAQRLRLDRCDVSLLRAFGGTNFEGSRFAACHGAGARFPGAKLARCDFSFSELDRADFSGAELSEAKLLGCRLRAARFDAAALHGASMVRADLMQAKLEGAKLVDADLRGANLFQAELLGADLRGAMLELAELHGTRLVRP